MKKLLGAVLGLALMIPSGPASADILKNLTMNGSVEIQAVSARNVQFLNTPTFQQIGDAQTRVLLNTGWDLLDDVHSTVTLRKNDRIYGSQGGNPGGAVGQSQPLGQNFAGATSQGVLGDIFVDQANIKIDKLVGNVDLRVGRQFFGEPGDLVAYFGPKYNLYGMAVTALDAGRFDWSNDMVGVTGVVGKITANAAQGTFTGTDSGGTTDLRGLIATMKGNENLSGGVQLYNRVSHNSITTDFNRNDYLWVVGAKAKWTAGGFWVKGEVDKDFGEDRNVNPFPTVAPTGIPYDNYTGWAFLVNAGYKADLPGFGVLTPWAELGDGSGGTKPGQTFTAIAGDYRPGGIYGLFAPGAITTLGGGGNIPPFVPTPIATNTLANRVILGFGVKAAPASAPKWTGGLSYWNYHFQTANGTNVTTNPPFPTAGIQLAQGNKFLGQEIDININYAHSDNVIAGITLGQFLPGGAVRAGDAVAGRAFGINVSADPVTLAEANLTVKF